MSWKEIIFYLVLVAVAAVGYFVIMSAGVSNQGTTLRTGVVGSGISEVFPGDEIEIGEQLQGAIKDLLAETIRNWAIELEKEGLYLEADPDDPGTLIIVDADGNKI